MPLTIIKSRCMVKENSKFNLEKGSILNHKLTVLLYTWHITSLIWWIENTTWNSSTWNGHHHPLFSIWICRTLDDTTSNQITKVIGIHGLPWYSLSHVEYWGGGGSHHEGCCTNCISSIIGYKKWSQMEGNIRPYVALIWWKPIKVLLG